MSYYKPVTTISSIGTISQPIPVTIASATAPATRENGGDLRQGDIWYNTDTGAAYVYVQGDWEIIGTGATAPPAPPQAFSGGFVPTTIMVGGSEVEPNLTLSSDGGIKATDTVEVLSPTANGVAFIVKDQAETEGLRVLADGTLQLGQKTGDVDALAVGVQINPAGSIDLGPARLEVLSLNGEDTLYLNNDPIISATSLDTQNLRLTNPSTAINPLFSRFNVAALRDLPPVIGLETQLDYNEWTFAAVSYLEQAKIDEAPEDGLTYGRNNGIWTQVTSVSPKGSVPDVAALNNIVNPQNGDMYLVESDGHAYVYENGTWVDFGDIRGPKGDTGPDGQAATVAVGSTATGAAGTSAQVTNTGNTSHAIFDFVIPQGLQGLQGPAGQNGTDGTNGTNGSPGAKGADGEAATITVGTTTTGAPGTDASVTNVGNTSEAIFNFSIPRGEKGETGQNGADSTVPGPDGTAATVDVGTTTTIATGLSAEVSNSGTTSAAVFDFKIPQGPKGETGESGSNGSAGNDGAAATINVGTTQTLSPGEDATVANAGTTSAAVFNFGIPKGEKGDTGLTGGNGNDGAAATITVGSTTTGAAGTNAVVSNSGSTSAAIFDFTIPQGVQGETGPQGNDGTSISLSGTVATVADLPTNAPAGEMYIVEADGNGYVSDGETPANWTNVGKIQGPEGPQGPAGPVGGSNTQILFNDNGTCSGAPDLTFASNTLTTDKIVTTGDITVQAGGFFVGDGSKLTGINIPNSFEFQGDVDVVNDEAPALGADDAGYFYVNTEAGVAKASWTGIGGNTLVADQTLFWDGSAFFAGAQQSNNTALQLTGGTMTGDIIFAGTQSFPSSGLPSASTGQSGIVQLSSAVDSDSETNAATSKAVKTVNDQVGTNTTNIATNTGDIATNTSNISTNTGNISSLTTSLGTTDGAVAANTSNIATNTGNIATNTGNITTAQNTADAALPKSGGTMTGAIVFADDQTFPSDIDVDPDNLPSASLTAKGIVQLSSATDSDSEALASTPKATKEAMDASVAANSAAVSAKATADAALPKAGGTMTGDIVFAGTQTFPNVTVDPSSLPEASVSKAGIVQLNDTTDSDSIILAATANSVKTAFERGSLGVTNASIAQQAAEDASDEAEAANAVAGTAQQAAIAAQDTADDAASDAATAQQAAEDAQETADNAAEAAQTAQNTADAAMPKAGGTFTGEVLGLTPTADSDEKTLTTKDYVLQETSKVAGAAVKLQDNAPVGAKVGDLWYNSVDGITYVYYEDEDSSQWVDVRPPGTSIAVGSLLTLTARTSLPSGGKTGDIVNVNDTLYFHGIDRWFRINLTPVG